MHNFSSPLKFNWVFVLRDNDRKNGGDWDVDTNYYSVFPDGTVEFYAQKRPWDYSPDGPSVLQINADAVRHTFRITQFMHFNRSNVRIRTTNYDDSVLETYSPGTYIAACIEKLTSSYTPHPYAPY